MTISESIVNWLNEFDKADFSEIATDFIEAESGTYAIFKTPQKTEKKYLDGSRKNTEYYNLFARQSSQLNIERIDNEQILEDLEDWIEAKNNEHDLPDLKPGCNCLSVAVNNAAAIISQEEDNAIYQVIIKIKYVKESIK